MPDFTAPYAAAIFILTIALSAFGLYRSPALVSRLLMRPYFVARGKMLETTVTSGFVHGDLPHLLFNMFTFYFFAFDMERFLGSGRFLILYFSGLVLSSACSVVKHRNNPEYGTLGASGAISAVLFAFAVYFPTDTLVILPIPIPIPAILFAVLYVAYSWWASRQQRGNINHDAHLCGAVTGLFFVAIVDPNAYSRLFAML